MGFDPEAVIDHLRRADPALGRIIDAVGPLTMPRRPNPFQALAHAIMFQQLAGTAARAILGRFLAIYTPTDGRPASDDHFPTPDEVIATPEEALRAAGISRQKIAYLRDLAQKFASGQIDPSRFDPLDDEEIIRQLTAIKGIGRWTAEMFLMFSLGRPDVLPVDDLGLRKAIQQAYGLPVLPKADEMERIAKPWRPYRSLATYYLWQSQRIITMADEQAPVD